MSGTCTQQAEMMMMTITGQIMGDMIRYFANDVKRINHALTVHSFATLIAGEAGLTGQEMEIVAIAALLHDIGIHEAEKKHGSSAGKWQEMEGPPLARQILSPYSLPSDQCDRVCFLIGNHHSYSRIDGPDFQILVEADFIVNIHEDGMNEDQIRRIREKIFKTGPGRRILDGMYLPATDA